MIVSSGEYSDEKNIENKFIFAIPLLAVALAAQADYISYSNGGKVSSRFVLHQDFNLCPDAPGTVTTKVGSGTESRHSFSSCVAEAGAETSNVRVYVRSKSSNKFVQICYFTFKLNGDLTISGSNGKRCHSSTNGRNGNITIIPVAKS